MTDDHDRPELASPPCYGAEFEHWADRPPTMDPVASRDVALWRKAERERLIAARLDVPAEDRRRLAEEVADELDRLVDPAPGLTVSLYWPFRGELDLRPWMTHAFRHGARVVLPLVEAKARPLVFREWWPDCPMTRGVWNIPIPAEGDPVVPDVVIAPLVGHDPACYRLGYGGGFFDRTLAVLQPRARAIGVGHPVSAIRTIYAQPHDIPMDVIVTGAGKVRRCVQGS